MAYAIKNISGGEFFKRFFHRIVEILTSVTIWRGIWFWNVIYNDHLYLTSFPGLNWIITHQANQNHVKAPGWGSLWQDVSSAQKSQRSTVLRKMRQPVSPAHTKTYLTFKSVWPLQARFSKRSSYFLQPELYVRQGDEWTHVLFDDEWTHVLFDGILDIFTERFILPKHT